MERHGESVSQLWRAIIEPGDELDPKTIGVWRRGSKSPRDCKSLVYLRRIETRYGLPEGYFQSKLPHPARAVLRSPIRRLSRSEQRRLAWHLPDDFEQLSRAKQDEILSWVQETVIAGATDYRRYQAAAMKHRFAIRFPKPEEQISLEEDDGASSEFANPELCAGPLQAPAHLADEMRRLMYFKTTTLTPTGYVRRGVWGPETASQKLEHPRSASWPTACAANSDGQIATKAGRSLSRQSRSKTRTQVFSQVGPIAWCCPISAGSTATSKAILTLCVRTA